MVLTSFINGTPTRSTKTKSIFGNASSMFSNSSILFECINLVLRYSALIWSCNFSFLLSQGFVYLVKMMNLIIPLCKIIYVLTMSLAYAIFLYVQYYNTDWLKIQWSIFTHSHYYR